MKISISELVDPHAARVVVRRDHSGTVTSAKFDIRGVPRVDQMLLGRPVAQVPALITRLCGLCPVTHHLAGIAALDSLYGYRISDTAKAIRALLHHGSVVSVMGPKLLHHEANPTLARRVHRLGKTTCAAAGMTGHFPDVAVPGGVAVTVRLEDVEKLHQEALTCRAEVLNLDAGQAPQFEFPGYNLSLVDATGRWDPLGDTVQLTYAADTDQPSITFPVAEIVDRIRETEPGSITPNPQVRIGETWQPYRVGPAARHLALTPVQAQLKSITESITEIIKLCESESLTAEEEQPTPTTTTVTGTGIGAIDGPRGLLIHRYTARDGNLTECQILSPTAQNEPWLAHTLRYVISHGQVELVEDAIRAADPCLPCTTAPRGLMNVEIIEEPCA
ncbi:coenzyme F420-reducing hydrogenase, alpha subunit [Corynebacterium mustelae]|uniref:Coenzyme F420-reducing hydrogenase, alpha subunit n=1 Tax=Corynebacterium mustelae TaxID=571915 RepID=A0A0G3GV84_9CORY|nr:nickel-dependent hydrogenase large subunit [Corynebacterium mustelae]AKK05091.1 coenzyme F420-reducing hydrogenase, alpha subunit [Corynebacterium mustelae]